MYKLCMKIQYFLETLGKGKPIQLVMMGTSALQQGVFTMCPQHQ